LSCSATLRRREPLISSRASFAASRCSAPPWTPRAAHFEPRAPCILELHGGLTRRGLTQGGAEQLEAVKSALLEVSGARRPKVVVQLEAAKARDSK